MTPSSTAVRGTVVLDLDGVVYLGGEGIPGAGDAMRELAESGWRLVMATNNASKTPEQVAGKISDLTGYTPEVGHVVTSGMAAASHVSGRYRSALVVGEPALHSALSSKGIDTAGRGEVDVVVVGIDFSFSYDTVDRAARAIRDGAAFVATNTDATFPTPHGLAPGSGAIVAAVTTASGVRPVVCGKPETAMRSLINAHIVGSSVWVIGDRPETDIAMATAEGWNSMLPLTGVTTESEVDTLAHTPDVVVESLAHGIEIITERDDTRRRYGG